MLLYTVQYVSAHVYKLLAQALADLSHAVLHDRASAKQPHGGVLGAASTADQLAAAPHQPLLQASYLGALEQYVLKKVGCAIVGISLKPTA